MHDGSSVPGASGVTVRLLGPGDAGLLRRLRLGALLDASDMLLGDVTAERRRPWTAWRDDASTGTWFVAESSGEAVGLARLVAYADEFPPLHLETLWVRPHRRRLGVARRLVAFGEGLALQRGHDAVGLWSMTSNAAAVSLWTSLGYVPTGREDDLPGGRHEREWMRRLRRRWDVQAG